MSVRQIGEGHRSSIGFRTGVVDRRRRGHDRPAGAVRHGPARSTPGHARRRAVPASVADDGDDASRRLGARSPRPDVQRRRARASRLERAARPSATPAATSPQTVDRHPREIAGRSYDVRFDASSSLGERVLCPATAAESTRHGGRPLRALRRRRRRASTYYATYTAFDGRAITQQLLATDDFASLHRRRRCAGRRRTTRAWPCSRAGSADGSSRSPATTARRTPSPSPTTSAAGRPSSPLDVAHRAVGGRPGRQLRLADRDRRRLARAHPRRRCRCAPTRSAPCCSTSTTRPIVARPHRRRPLLTAAARRAGRLRAQRRVLVRGPAPRRPAPRAVRHRRRQRRLSGLRARRGTGDAGATRTVRPHPRSTPTGGRHRG